MAFDRLYVNGHDLRARPLHERRMALDEQIRDQRLVLPVRRLAADGLEAWAEVERRGYEGTGDGPLIAENPDRPEPRSSPARRYDRVEIRLEL